MRQNCYVPLWIYSRQFIRDRGPSHLNWILNFSLPIDTAPPLVNWISKHFVVFLWFVGSQAQLIKISHTRRCLCLQKEDILIADFWHVSNNSSKKHSHICKCYIISDTQSYCPVSKIMQNACRFLGFVSMTVVNSKLKQKAYLNAVLFLCMLATSHEQETTACLYSVALKNLLNLPVFLLEREIG